MAKTTSLSSQLIKGAADVAQAQAKKGFASMAGGFAIGQAVQNVGTNFTNYVNTKNKEYQGVAQKVLDEAGHLPADEYSALYDDLMEGKRGYMFGGSKSRALSIRDLNMKAQDYSDYKDFRLNLSELVSGENPEGDSISSYFAATAEGQAYLDLLQDNSRLKQKVCPDEQQNCPDKGRMVVIIKDKNGQEQWTSISKLKQDVNKNLYDKGFKTGLFGLADKLTEASLKVQEGENVEFPRKLIQQQVATLLGDTANRRSVAYDVMFGNSSFYDDLVSKISSGSYSDLGITEEQVKSMDTNGGAVTKEDAEAIVRELIDNPDYVHLANQEMTRYFTGFLAQNFDNAAQGRTSSLPGYEVTKGGRRVKIKDLKDSLTSGDFAPEGGGNYYLDTEMIALLKEAYEMGGGETDKPNTDYAD